MTGLTVSAQGGGNCNAKEARSLASDDRGANGKGATGKAKDSLVHQSLSGHQHERERASRRSPVFA